VDVADVGVGDGVGTEVVDQGFGIDVEAVGQGVGVAAADVGVGADVEAVGESVGAGVPGAVVVNSELTVHADAAWPWAALTETSA
jgi:hypothetical protein